jgi:hypothetical protein
MENINEKLSQKVDKSTRINNYELTSDITLKKSDINLSLVDNMSLQNTLRVIRTSINNLSSTIQLFSSSIINKVDNFRTINNKSLSTNIILDKTAIGLSNINNTSDLNKPISTLTQNALNLKVDKLIKFNVTSNIVAVENGEYYTDTTLNTITITLPLLTSDSKILIIDVNNTWNINNLILLPSNNVSLNNNTISYNVMTGNYIEVYYNSSKSNWYFNNNKSYGQFSLNLPTISNNLNILNWLPIFGNTISCIDSIFILNNNTFYNIIIQLNITNNINGIVQLIYQYSNDNGVTWNTQSSIKLNIINMSVCGNIFLNTFTSNVWRFQLDNQVGSNLNLDTVQSIISIINV